MLPNIFRRISKTRPADISSARLELSSVCQLRCPSCPTGRGQTKDSAVGWGHLSIENFKKFLDGNPKIKELELSNWGEAFLNPDIEAMLECAQSRGVAMTLWNGANLNFAKDSTLEAVVRYGMRELKVSIDGASQETYAIYRKGGDFGKVIENVRRLNDYKAKYQSALPKLTWQFVIFGHNEHEIPAARKMASELGMEFFPRKSWDPVFSPARNWKTISQETGRSLTTRLGRLMAHVRDNAKSGYCACLWNSPQVNWDGALLGCPVNFKVAHGNVFDDGLAAAMASESYQRMQRVVSGKELPTKDVPCFTCTTWRNNLRYRYAGQIFVMRLLRSVHGLFGFGGGL